MGKWIVEQLILEMAKKDLIISKAKVLILGLAFKENCTDIRNTKVKDILNSLIDYKIDVFISDPCVDIEEANQKFGNRIFKEIQEEYRYDAIIVAVGHDNYKKISVEKWRSLIKENGIIFDLKGILPRKLGAHRL